MKIARMLTVVLLAAISLAAWTAQSSAAVRGGPAGTREATTARCIAEARRHYPGKYYDWGEVRDFQYENCMHDAGFPP
jgi:hypothetical protein